MLVWLAVKYDYMMGYINYKKKKKTYLLEAHEKKRHKGQIDKKIGR